MRTINNIILEFGNNSISTTVALPKTCETQNESTARGVGFGYYPGVKPALSIFAIPASGKTTFMTSLEGRTFIDTDHNLPFDGCAMITNIYEYSHVSNLSYALLPSREVYDGRLAYRGFSSNLLDYWEYDLVLKSLSPKTIIIRSDKYLYEELKLLGVGSSGSQV